MNVTKRPALLAGFLEDLNRLYGEMLEHFEFRPPREEGLFALKSRSAIDVIENENGFTVCCELPGLAREDLAVSVAGHVLSLKGGRREEKTIRENGLLRTTSWFNAFYRSLPLPPGVDVMRSWAELKNGVLMIVLPKRKAVVADRGSLQRA